MRKIGYTQNSWQNDRAKIAVSGTFQSEEV